VSDRPTLDSASGAAAILEALARATWTKAHDGAECPAERIPSAADLADWLAECPAANRADADARTAALLGAPAAWRRMVEHDSAAATVAAVVENEAPRDGRRMVTMSGPFGGPPGLPAGELRGSGAAGSASIADDLAAWQDAADQHRPPVVTQVFRFVRPPGDKGAKIALRRCNVFVQVKHREAVGRIPAPAAPFRDARLARVGPTRIRDAPPDVGVGYRLAQQLQGQVCARSNRNMSRQAASTVRVSRRPQSATRDSPPSAGIGRRTTAGMRSRSRRRTSRSLASARSAIAPARLDGAPCRSHLPTV